MANPDDTMGCRTPTFGELRAFSALARDLHFRRAAARLGVAQPSLSQTIRRLEGRLGGALFERTSRSVALTPRGRDLLPRAEDLLARLERLDACARRPRADPPTLRLGVTGAGAGELTGPILAAFRRRRPGVRLVVGEMTQDPRAVVAGRFDVAFTQLPFADERLAVHELASEPRGVLVPADHPLADAEAAPMAGFLDEPFLAVVPSRPPVRDYWLAVEHRAGERPRIGGQTWDISGAVHGVVHLGLTTTAARSFARAFPVPGMAFVDVPDLAPATMVVAARADDEREEVLDLVAAAREVAARAGELAPDLWPAGDRMRPIVAAPGGGAAPRRA
jgi:DNA-binding transcriptional LysR family regulator